MAALCHLLSDPDAGELWLKDWADKLGRPELAALELRSTRHVIAEPLLPCRRCVGSSRLVPRKNPRSHGS